MKINDMIKDNDEMYEIVIVNYWRYVVTVEKAGIYMVSQKIERNFEDKVFELFLIYVVIDNEMYVSVPGEDF